MSAPGAFWAAVLDGDMAGADLRKTQEEALRDKEWLEKHPARKDRVLFGHGGVVQVMLLEESEWTGELVEVTR